MATREIGSSCVTIFIVRVLILSPIISGAFGQERVIRDSMALLRAAGNQVFLIGGETKLAAPESDGFQIFPDLLESNSFFHFARAEKRSQKVLKAVDSYKPDVIHLVDIFDTTLVNALNRRYPTISTAHLYSHTCPASTRMLETKDGFSVCNKTVGLSCVLSHQKYNCMSTFKNNLVRAHVTYELLLKQRSQKNLRAIIAISQHMQKSLLENGYPASKVKLVYNPVKIPERPRVTEKMPENLLVCASRLVRHKGVPLLLRALASIKEMNWTLWVLGDGIERSLCEDLSKELGLSSRVSFLGHVSYERAQEIVSQAKALVQPNLGPEPFGLSVAEASSLGVPVIASRVPALNEVVEHEKTGLLFTPGDSKALADSLSRILMDKNLWEKLSANGPESIQTRFSPEEHLRRTLETYRFAMGEARPLSLASLASPCNL